MNDQQNSQCPDFSKGINSLLPAIIQHNISGVVLMLGYMNAEAFAKTVQTKKVTFFSRSKNRLWMKGEESGNFLELVEYRVDCDADTILCTAKPLGPTCHTGTQSCFGDEILPSTSFLATLEALLRDRKENPIAGSYTSTLFADADARLAQKVGEEGVEVAIATVKGDSVELISEVSDLWFHSLALLVKKGISLETILAELRARHKARSVRA